MRNLLVGRMRMMGIVAALLFIACLGDTFAIDTDNDGMSDVYEAVFNLNSADAEDAALHYDNDTLNNLEESVIFTDPFAPDTDHDGFADGVDSNALSRAVVMWGHPDFTDEEQYSYTGPSWWLTAKKNGGQWFAGECWDVAASNALSVLELTVDRSVLTNNLMMTLSFDDSVDSEMKIGLCSAAGDVLADNLFGDVTDGTGEKIDKTFVLPMATFASAAIIRITVAENGGPCRVYSTVLFVDVDQDGLDADQEQQLNLSDRNPDSDADSLSDGDEVLVHKSNPLSADSDQDGIADFNEVEQGTSPILADTDNDGLLDNAEPALGTDPVKADSDGDGLSDSYELNATYFLIHQLMTWDEAKVHAEQLGGHLVVISSEEEHLKVMEAVGSGIADNMYRPWIGLSDFGHEGNWAWVTGEPFGYARWRDGEPSNGGNQEHYVQYYGGDVWNDNHIRTKAPYILEKQGGLDPLSPDCDGDGLPDGVEIALGSSPMLVDTDNDGFTDSEEVEQGTSPIAADSDKDGLSDFEELSSVYALVRTDLSWLESKADAEKRGGHMLAIADEGEFTTIIEKFGEDELNSRKPWIGLSDHGQEGS